MTSSDGTTIAYDRQGRGPAVVLVGGALDDGGRLARTVMRARRPVVQTCFAFLAESSDPTVRALAGHALSLGSVGDRPALLADALDEQLPASEVQPGITVGHEDLRTVDDLDIAHRTRRSSLRQQPARGVTNLVAEYS